MRVDPVYLPHVWDGRNRTFWYFSERLLADRGDLRQ